MDVVCEEGANSTAQRAVWHSAHCRLVSHRQWCLCNYLWSAFTRLLFWIEKLKKIVDTSLSLLCFNMRDSICIFIHMYTCCSVFSDTSLAPIHGYCTRLHIPFSNWPTSPFGAPGARHSWRDNLCDDGWDQGGCARDAFRRLSPLHTKRRTREYDETLEDLPRWPVDETLSTAFELVHPLITGVLVQFKGLIIVIRGVHNHLLNLDAFIGFFWRVLCNAEYGVRITRLV